MMQFKIRGKSRQNDLWHAIKSKPMNTNTNPCVILELIYLEGSVQSFIVIFLSILEKYFFMSGCMAEKNQPQKTEM